MSFYGVTQYQLADTFSQLVFSNPGKDSSMVIAPSNILVENQTINAIGRKSAMHFKGGNRWIQFDVNTETNTATLWHMAPDITNSSLISPLNLESHIPNSNSIVEINLGKDVYFSLPKLSYDPTGHLICDEQRFYYHIPKIDIQAQVDGISNKVDTLEDNITAFETTVNNQVSSLGQLVTSSGADIQENEKNISSITSSLGDYTSFSPNQSEQLYNFLGNAEDLKKSLETTKTLCVLLKEVILEVKELSALSISTINKIEKIEERLTALEQ